WSIGSLTIRGLVARGMPWAFPIIASDVGQRSSLHGNKERHGSLNTSFSLRTLLQPVESVDHASAVSFPDPLEMQERVPQVGTGSVARSRWGFGAGLAIVAAVENRTFSRWSGYSFRGVPRFHESFLRPDGTVGNRSAPG